MSELVKVYTQHDMERVLREGNRPVCVGDGRFEARESAHVEARGSAHVVARGSAHVEAWGSAHVVARESAYVVARESAHVVARGSAHVEAWESAHVVARGSAYVVAWESAHVVAWGSAYVVASRFVATHRHSDRATVQGGVVIDVERPTTPEAWCEFYGIAVLDGVATLYKAVGDDYQSRHGLAYEPGTTPEAPDWDGGYQECGGGLHFSPHPMMAREFHPSATRYVACPVALSDFRAPAAIDSMPQKIKARRVCGPIVEVDRSGDPLAKGTSDE